MKYSFNYFLTVILLCSQPALCGERNKNDPVKQTGLSVAAQIKIAQNFPGHTLQGFRNKHPSANKENSRIGENSPVHAHIRAIEAKVRSNTSPLFSEVNRSVNNVSKHIKTQTDKDPLNGASVSATLIHGVRSSLQDVNTLRTVFHGGWKPASQQLLAQATQQTKLGRTKLIPMVAAAANRIGNLDNRVAVYNTGLSAVEHHVDLGDNLSTSGAVVRTVGTSLQLFKTPLQINSMTSLLKPSQIAHGIATTSDAQTASAFFKTQSLEWVDLTELLKGHKNPTDGSPF